MKRKLLSVLLVSALTMSTLVGCGGGTNEEVTKATDEFIEEVDKLMGEETDEVAEKVEVTAESLFENAIAESENSSMDLNLVLDIALDADTINTDGDMSITGSLGMAVDATIKTETDKDTVHSYGNMKLDMMGMSIEMPMDEYYDLSKEPYIAYKSSQDSSGGVIWEAEEVDEVPNSLTNVDFSDINDDAELTLLAEDTDEDYYVVEALVKNMDLSDIEEMSGSDLSEVDVKMFFYFDKETQKLSKINADMTDILKSAGEVEGVSFNTFKFDIVINDFNSEVTIPEDVLTYSGSTGTVEVTDNEIAVAADPNSEGKTLLHTYWGISEFATSDDIAKAIGVDKNMFNNEEWGKVYNSISNFLNNYTEKELLDYLEYFQYSTEYEQIALVKIAQVLDGKSTEYNTSVLDEVLGNNRNYEDALELIAEHNL